MHDLDHVLQYLMGNCSDMRNSCLYINQVTLEFLLCFIYEVQQYSGPSLI